MIQKWWFCFERRRTFRSTKKKVRSCRIAGIVGWKFKLKRLKN